MLSLFNPLNTELNPVCYLLALLGAHHFLHVSRIRVKSLTLRLLMSYIYIYIYDISSLRVKRNATNVRCNKYAAYPENVQIEVQILRHRLGGGEGKGKAVPVEASYRP